jgi:hypothetical protein
LPKSNVCSAVFSVWPFHQVKIRASHVIGLICLRLCGSDPPTSGVYDPARRRRPEWARKRFLN